MPDDEIPTTGNPAGFIRGLLDEGVGPTAGLRAFRDAGGAINDGRWFNLYQQVDNGIQRQPSVLGLDPFTLPGATDYGDPWAAGRGGQYATTVSLSFVDRDTGDWLTRYYTHITDEPHTLVEAEQAAQDELGDTETENQYGETLMGALATNIYQTIPYGAGG